MDNNSQPNTTIDNMLTPMDGELNTEHNTESPPETIRIGDEELTLEDAKKFLSMGKDATKKWTEASQLRKEAEQLQLQVKPLQDLYNQFASLPPTEQMRIAEIISNQGNGNNPGTQNPYGQSTGLAQHPAELGTPNVDWENLTEEGRMLYIHNQRLRQEMTQLVGTVKELMGPVKDFSEQRRFEQMAEVAKTQGYKVTASDLKQLSTEYGVSDPLKLLPLISKATQDAYNAGTQNVAKAPEVPETTTKTFDPTDPSLTADDMLRLRMQGYTPVKK